MSTATKKQRFARDALIAELDEVNGRQTPKPKPRPLFRRKSAKAENRGSLTGTRETR